MANPMKEITGISEWEKYLIFDKGFQAGLEHKNSLSWYKKIKVLIKDICKQVVHG